MSLVVITGGARSGKSGVAQGLAERSATPVTVAVFARAEGDEEMAARIERHRADRPQSWTVCEARDANEWIERIGPGTLLVDCLGTLLALVMEDVSTEEEIHARFDPIVEWIAGRSDDTIVVTNEVGSGIVPANASARVFRDVLGRVNRRLVDSADAAYLVVAGRCIDLSVLPETAHWPSRGAIR